MAVMSGQVSSESLRTLSDAKAARFLAFTFLDWEVVLFSSFLPPKSCTAQGNTDLVRILGYSC